MLTIGLTGGIGVGKSTVADFFSKKGINVIDADEIAKELSQPGCYAFHAILKHFGSEILNADQGLNRKNLKKIIFSNPKEKEWLEKLLHPIILEEMRKRIKGSTSPYCILVIPLLTKTALTYPLVKRVLLVRASLEVQISRVSKRDQLSKKEIEGIINNQAKEEERLKIADDVIWNKAEGPEALEKEVNKLHEKYLEQSIEN